MRCTLSGRKTLLASNSPRGYFLNLRALHRIGNRFVHTRRWWESLWLWSTWVRRDSKRLENCLVTFLLVKSEVYAVTRSCSCALFKRSWTFGKVIWFIVLTRRIKSQTFLVKISFLMTLVLRADTDYCCHRLIQFYSANGDVYYFYFIPQLLSREFHFLNSTLCNRSLRMSPTNVDVVE